MRALAALLALLCAVAGLSAITSSARADSSMLCNGYAACSANGYTTHGYPSHINTSYWGQYAGVNCTNYTAFVLSTAFHAPTPGYRLGNGSDWDNSAAAHGVPVNGTPSVGSVAQWDGNTTGMGPMGHVAVVERVATDGSYIDISQDSIGSDKDKYDWRRIYRGTNGWQSWPSHFIHFPVTLPAPVLHDGMYAQVGTTVYTIAGGAPLLVSTWANVGGRHPTTVISAAQFSRLPRFPKDGTLIRDLHTGRVYTVAGGAPLFVSTWANVGGPHASIGVDGADISHAGAPAPWDHLRPVPLNGVFLRISSGRVYMTAGGSPFWLSTWSTVGGTKPTVLVDSYDITHRSDPASHLYPVPGEPIRSLPDQQTWSFANHCYAATPGAAGAVPAPRSGFADYTAC